MDTNSFNFNFDTNQPVSVSDKSVASILADIYKSLFESSKKEEEYNRTIDSYLGDMSNRQTTSDRERSAHNKASMSNDRVVQKALSGISNDQKKSIAAENKNRAIDRALSASNTKNASKDLKNLRDGILSGLNSLKNAILPHLLNHFKSQADLAKRMRQNFATREEKDNAQRMANSMQSTVEAKFGYKLDRSEINDYLITLQTMGKDLDTMGEERVAAFAALKKSGLSDAAALKAAMSASADTVNKLTDAATDPRARQLILKQIESASDAELAVIGVDNVFSQIATSSQSLAKSAGNAIVDFDKMSESLANNRRAANGMNEEVDGAMLAIQGGIRSIGSEGENILKQANQYSTEQLRALLQSSDEATRSMAQQMLQIKNMQMSGASVGTNVRTSKQNKEVKEINATNGLLNFGIQSLLGNLDNSVFGTTFGKLSNRMDEIFGDSADLTTIVSTGFTIVTKLLSSLNMKTGFVGKALLGVGGAAAVVAIISNWDKIKPKLASAMEAIKPIINDVAKNIPTFIKDAFGSIGGIFGGSDGLVSSASGSIKSAMSGDTARSFREFGSSVGGFIKSLLDLITSLLGAAGPLVKGIVDGVGNILVGIMPGLSSIVHDVSEVINKVVDAIAPAIPGILSVLNGIVEAVTSIGTSIISALSDIVITFINTAGAVLQPLSKAVESIAHSIEILSEALAPVVPIIVDMLSFAVKTVLPPLVNNLIPKILSIAEKFVNIILPPAIDLLKHIVNVILPPIMDIMKIAIREILPVIVYAVQKTVDIVDRILNFIVDLIEPPLRAISEAIIAVVNLATNITSFVNDIVVSTRGMFNYIVSKVPNIIGWISGLFTYIKDGFVPIVKEGFNIVKDTMSWLLSELNLAITKFIAAPIVTALNGLDVLVKGIQYILMEKFDFFGENDETAEARKAYQKSLERLTGKSESGQEALNYNNAKNAFEAALEDNSISSDDLKKLADTYRKASEAYQSEAGADITRAEIESQLEKRGFLDSVDRFKKAINSDILKNGVQIDEREANEVQKFLDAAKDRTQLQVLPPNIGSLLESISKNVSSSTESLKNLLSFFTSLDMHANGTPSTRGPAIVGESGREAVLPLENPSLMKRIFGKMHLSDKKKVLEAVGLHDTDFSKRVLEGARAQYGKKYSEMVCNQLVEAALKYAGFKTPTTGIVSKHFNHQKMRLILNDPENGISPNDSKLIPGMILFSHPFTQEEVNQLNLSKGGNRRVGDPGHMGIYAGNGKWWNSTSSKNTIDFSSGKGIRVTDSDKGFGVALTSPSTKGKYKLFAAGFYDGMFYSSGMSSVSSNKPFPSGEASIEEKAAAVGMTPDEYSRLYSNMAESTDIIAEGAKAKQETQLDTLRNLSRNAMNTIIAQTSGQVKYEVSKSKANQRISSNDSHKDEIILAMKDVVRYLRDMASFVKKPGATAPARLPHA